MYGYVRDVIVLFSPVRRASYGPGNGGRFRRKSHENRRGFYDSKNGQRLFGRKRHYSAKQPANCPPIQIFRGRGGTINEYVHTIAFFFFAVLFEIFYELNR